MYIQSYIMLGEKFAKFQRNAIETITKLKKSLDNKANA